MPQRAAESPPLSLPPRLLQGEDRVRWDSCLPSPVISGIAHPFSAGTSQSRTQLVGNGQG
jgi:hypothetical protein